MFYCTVYNVLYYIVDPQQFADPNTQFIVVARLPKLAKLKVGIEIIPDTRITPSTRTIPDTDFIPDAFITTPSIHHPRFTHHPRKHSFRIQTSPPIPTGCPMHATSRILACVQISHRCLQVQYLLYKQGHSSATITVYCSL